MFGQGPLIQFFFYPIHNYLSLDGDLGFGSGLLVGLGLFSGISTERDRLAKGWIDCNEIGPSWVLPGLTCPTCRDGLAYCPKILYKKNNIYIKTRSKKSLIPSSQQEFQIWDLRPQIH